MRSFPCQRTVCSYWSKIRRRALSLNRTRATDVRLAIISRLLLSSSEFQWISNFSSQRSRPRRSLEMIRRHSKTPEPGLSMLHLLSPMLLSTAAPSAAALSRHGPNERGAHSPAPPGGTPMLYAKVYRRAQAKTLSYFASCCSSYIQSADKCTHLLFSPRGRPSCSV